ncbi:MAG: glycosyltransferase family 1 protein [Deltaproteobacteria bacterium]|nr:glycosyltransferase family 1 protein [Deltaproteobacteria bacterium]
MPSISLARHGNGANRRHICFVTETYPPEINGVALTLARLVKGLAMRGHAVSMIRPYQRVLDSTASDLSVTLVRGLPLPGYNGLQCGLPAGHLLKRVWTKQRPDIVYVATEGPLGWSAVCTARRLRIVTLSGFHTNYHSYSRHYRLGFLQPLVFRYLRCLHNRTCGTMVPSFDLRDGLHALGFKNLTYLGRGVDSSLFAPEHRCAELRQSWGLSDRGLAVLYVGRIAPEKNLRLAIEAYRAMCQVDDSIKFILVGDGPLRSILQIQYPNLIFCGTRTGEALARHYASGDIFLFPSETETFGNVTLEAMASGVAVVAYNYAAAKLHITHGETGLLAPCGDSKAFIGLATRLVREMGWLYQLRTQAREYAAALSWSDVIEKFESWLTDALTGSNTAVRATPPPRPLAIAGMGRL